MPPHPSNQHNDYGRSFCFRPFDQTRHHAAFPGGSGFEEACEGPAFVVEGSES